MRFRMTVSLYEIVFNSNAMLNIGSTFLWFCIFAPTRLFLFLSSLVCFLSLGSHSDIASACRVCWLDFRFRSPALHLVSEIFSLVSSSVFFSSSSLQSLYLLVPFFNLLLNFFSSCILDTLSHLFPNSYPETLGFCIISYFTLSYLLALYFLKKCFLLILKQAVLLTLLYLNFKSFYFSC